MASYVGGGAGCQGEGTAREANVETLHGGRLLWEEIWGTRNWESCCFCSAENCTIEAGSWWSFRNNWWDLIQEEKGYFLSV